jgi:hypothetical protein
VTIKKIQIDPKLETADIDVTNNIGQRKSWKVNLIITIKKKTLKESFLWKFKRNPKFGIFAVIKIQKYVGIG